MALKRRFLVLALALALSGLFFIDLCGFVFGCGCRSLWNGAAEACNIHDERGPHCPWCAHPLAGGAVAFLGSAALQSWIALRRGRAGPWLRLVLALLAFPLASGLLGALQGFWWRYGGG